MSVFHCSGGLALIGMLIVFILTGTEETRTGGKGTYQAETLKIRNT